MLNKVLDLVQALSPDMDLVDLQFITEDGILYRAQEVMEYKGGPVVVKLLEVEDDE